LKETNKSITKLKV